MKPTIKDYFTLHFVVLIYGFTAILGQLTTIHTLGLVFFRTFLATAGFYIYFKFKGLSIGIDCKGKWQLLITGGIVIALHWFTFFYAARFPRWQFHWQASLLLPFGRVLSSHF